MKALKLALALIYALLLASLAIDQSPRTVYDQPNTAARIGPKGTGAPPSTPTCVSGQLYFRINAPGGNPIYYCDSGVWKLSSVYDAGTVQWEDALVPVSQMSAGAAACTIGAYGPSGGVRAYRCAVGKDMDGQLQMPHARKTNTDIACHVHWMPTGGDATGGNVKWQLDYYWQSISAAASGAPTSITTSDSASGTTAWAHKLTSFPAISGTDKGISSMLMFTLTRIAAGSDEFADVVILSSFDCHYQVDSLGSKEEGVK